MKKSIAFGFIAAISLSLLKITAGQSSKHILRGDYLGQKVSTLQAEIFTPGIVSKFDEYEFGSVFSKDGNEFYYAVIVSGTPEIRFMLRTDNKWSKPEKMSFQDEYSYNDPFLSPDEKRLYFISDRTLNGSGKKKDIDIWYVNRQGNTWSAPINAGNMINSEKDEYYISFSKEGRIYFASNAETDKSDTWNFDIYYADFVDGAFQKPVKMSDKINTNEYEADVFIAPDETYIIFCSIRKEGFGEGDLYISFKENNKWSKAVNMGEQINTSGHELCPFVSKDGKYFFYTSNKDIYWIDAKILNKYRKE